MHSTCVGPQCRVGFSKCHIHHVVFWGHLGRTDEDVLVPVCSRHHHDLHEGGYRITIDTDRHVTWHRPDGTPYATVHPNRRNHANAA